MNISYKLKNMNKPIRVGILGLGRIGITHAENLATMKEYEMVMGADPFLTPEMEQTMKEIGIPVCSKEPEDIFSNPDIDAVLICSTTETHSDFIIRAAKAGKDIFCEKPIDHDVGRILKALEAVKKANVLLMVGFMHRYDKHHRAIYDIIRQGEIGQVEVLKITSRDPEPPTMKYIRSSGGIYVDFMIHDFDMARFLLNDEVVSVFATGTTISDPQIAKEGDVGSGHAILRFASGALGILETSRRSGFGNDQRIEALGSKGCVMNDNEYENNVKLFSTDGFRGAKSPLHFPQRYKDAFKVELEDFARCVIAREQPSVTGFDGLQAVLIAEAAARSAKSGRFEDVEVIEA